MFTGLLKGCVGSYTVATDSVVVKVVVLNKINKKIAHHPLILNFKKFLELTI